MPEPTEDLTALRINWMPSVELPAGSKTNYVYAGGLLVGGIVGADTLVTTSYAVEQPFSWEFLSYLNTEIRSHDTRSSYFHPEAVAPIELVSRYEDSTIWTSAFARDQLDGRLHKPMGLEVVQRCLGWTSGVAQQLLLVDLAIHNRGIKTIARPVVGIMTRPKIWNLEVHAGEPDGAICGYLGSIGGLIGGVRDSVVVAWASDNDGNPSYGSFDRFSATGVIATMILRAPAGARPTFNWWIDRDDGSGFGPQRNGASIENYGGLGRPRGDRGLSYMLRNGEIDYDQAYSAIDMSASGWRRPAGTDLQLANDADGGHIAFVLAMMSEDPLAPGDSILFTYAIASGEEFHTDPANLTVNFRPDDPSDYISGLNFKDLETTCRWADWIFDTPGVDTDGDGDYGKFHLVNCREQRCDTVWYRGDGVPDWGGPQAPPAPRFEPTTRPNAVTLRWTGEFSETAEDQFSRRRDCEGYRVYSARTNTEGEYALIASWDIPDNFRRFAYNSASGSWSQISYPLTVADWRRELSDPEFTPEAYPNPSLAYAYVDTVADTIRDASGGIVQIVTRERLSYWAPEGPNHGNTYPDGGEVYENHIQRVGIRDTVIGEDTLQYGVYEMTLDDLNAAIPLWFAVTAFDHGDYRRSLESLEGNPNANAQFAFPQYSADVVVDSGLNVTVYPNPYKILFADVHGNQTNYIAQGYEAYGQPVMDERERRIWFANLPDTATIRIYSLDGDLIREIHHPDKHLTRYSSIVGWDLISRNTQAVTSGIYIWRVDSRLGSQVGKIVIIK